MRLALQAASSFRNSCNRQKMTEDARLPDHVKDSAEKAGLCSIRASVLFVNGWVDAMTKRGTMRHSQLTVSSGLLG